MNHSRIGTIEALTIILSVMAIHTVLSLPKVLLDNTKSATILNLIYVTIIVLSFIYIIYKFFKIFPGMDIIDISEVLGGSIFKKIIGFIFILYFVSTSSIFLRNFCESIRVVYYPSTDILFVILFFIIAMCATNHLSFNASLKANLLIMPLLVGSVIFLFAANIDNFTPQRIFPILGDGFISTFATGLGNISAFGGIVFLYFIPPLLKEPKNFKKVAIFSVLVSSLYLILAVSIILFMFSFFIETDEIMPLYIASTYIEFGSFFQRLESVFLLIWMLVFACYLGIVSKFSLNIFKKITNIQDFKPLICPFTITFLAISLIPKNYAVSKYFEKNIYPYLVIALVFVTSFIILFLANLKHKKGSDKS